MQDLSSLSTEPGGSANFLLKLPVNIRPPGLLFSSRLLPWGRTQFSFRNPFYRVSEFHIPQCREFMFPQIPDTAFYVLAPFSYDQRPE